MPDDRLPLDELGTEPGLAGGPGPNPPGFDDGTPRVFGDGTPGRPAAGAVPGGRDIEDPEGEPPSRQATNDPAEPPRREAKPPREEGTLDDQG